jgi:3D (Asp-Asp-Asp) domain-containing protein
MGERKEAMKQWQWAAWALAISMSAGCVSDKVVGGGQEASADVADKATDTSSTQDAASDAASRDASDTRADIQPDTSPDVQPDTVSDTTPDTRPGPGTSIGTFWNTYYYLADEAGYSGADDTTLYDDSCNPIAEVPSEFADDACIEGSARLEDGTVINYHSPCSCGPCSFCWAEMDPDTHPWGMGSRGNALEPLVSWAVDTDVIERGTVVYVEAWDGVDIPQIGELGGFTHDGCFRADDVGGAINGNHFDFFAGTPQMWQALEGIYPTRTDFEVYVDSPRCSD